MTDKIIIKESNATNSLEVIFNNSKKNCIDKNMWTKLANIFLSKSNYKKYSCIIISGGENGPFSSGADLNDIITISNKEQAKEYYDNFVNKAITAITDCPIPTIASIKGECFGAGMMIAGSTDIRLSSKNALFCIPAAKLGITLSYKELYKLKKYINTNILKELLFTGKPIKAEAFIDSSFINKIFSDDKLYSETKKIASTIKENSFSSNCKHLEMISLIEEYGIKNIPKIFVDNQYEIFESVFFKNKTLLLKKLYKNKINSQ